MGIWPAAPGSITPIMVTTCSRLSLGRHAAAINDPAPVAGNLGTTNTAFFYPFVLPAPITVTKMFVYNGGTLAAAIDLGIYDANYGRVVSTGVTAQANANALQEIDVTDTMLDAGDYYFAVSHESALATFFQNLWTGDVQWNKAIGCLRQVVHPLPAIATPTASVTDSGVIIMGLSTRALVV